MGVAMEEPSQSTVSSLAESKSETKLTRSQKKNRSKKVNRRLRRITNLIITEESMTSRSESTETGKNEELKTEVSLIAGTVLETKKENSVIEANGGVSNLGNMDLIPRQDASAEVTPDLVGKQGVINVVERMRKRKRNKGKTRVIQNTILVEQRETDAQAVTSLSENLGLIQESLRGNDEKSNPEITDKELENKQKRSENEAKSEVSNVGNIDITKRQDANSETNPDLVGTQAVDSNVGKKQKRKKNKSKTRVMQNAILVEKIENEDKAVASLSEKPSLNEESFRGYDEKSTPEIAGKELENKQNSENEGKGGVSNLGNIDIIKRQDANSEINPDLVGTKGVDNNVGKKQKGKKNRGKARVMQNTILVEKIENEDKAVASLSEKPSLNEELFRGYDEKSTPEIAGKELENKQKNSENEAKSGVSNLGNMDIIKRQDANSEINPDLAETKVVDNNVGKKQKRKTNKGKTRVMQNTILAEQMENNDKNVTSLSEKPSLNEESLRGYDKKSSPEIAGKELENKQKNSENEAKSGVSNLGNIDLIKPQDADSEINPDLAGIQGVNNNDGEKQKRKKNKGKTRVMQNTILVEQIGNDDKAVTSLSEKSSLNEDFCRFNDEKSVPEIAGTELESKRKNPVIEEGSGVPNLGNMDVMNQQEANAEVNPDLSETQGIDNGVGRKGKKNKGKVRVVPNTISVKQNETEAKAAASQSQNKDIFRCNGETSSPAAAATGLESKRKTEPQRKKPKLENMDLVKQQDANAEVKSDLAGSQNANNEVGRKGKGKTSKGLMRVMPNTILVKQIETGTGAVASVSEKLSLKGELVRGNDEISGPKITGTELVNRKKDSVIEAKTEVPVFRNTDLLTGENVNAEVNLGFAGTQGVNNEIVRKGKRKRSKDKSSKSIIACADPKNANNEIGNAKEATENRECIAEISSAKDVSALQKDTKRIAMMEEVSSSIAISGGSVDIAAPGVACGKPKGLEESPISGEACQCHSRRKLLVLDLNGILADVLEIREIKHKEFIPDARLHGKSVFKRPYTDEFLRFCFERFDVCIWSSRVKGNVNKMIDILMGDEQQRVMLRWSRTECTKTKFKTLENKHKPLVMKELRKLWDYFGYCSCGKSKYNESNTLLVDDSPYKALRNPPHTGVFPNPYEYFRSEDSALGPQGDLRLYLEKVASAGNVQEFVKENPLGQPFITESHPSWDFYSQIKGDDKLT